MANTLVTIIILTYKDFRSLFHAIDSVVFQDYPELELIVSDDYSGNFPSTEIVRYIETKVKVSSLKSYQLLSMPENLGTVRHANIAAAKASGKYIRFLGADDEFFDPGVISDTVQYMERMNVPVSTSQVAIYNETLNKLLYLSPSKDEVKRINSLPPKQLFGELAVRGNIIGAPGVIFRQDFFHQYGGFNETYRLTEDYPTWLALLRNGVSIPCMERITVKYRLNGISSKANRKSATGRELFQELGNIYEIEILANETLLTRFQKRYSKFVYNRIAKLGKLSLPQRFIFTIQYLDVIFWRKISASRTKFTRFTYG